MAPLVLQLCFFLVNVNKSPLLLRSGEQEGTTHDIFARFLGFRLKSPPPIPLPPRPRPSPISPAVLPSPPGRWTAPARPAEEAAAGDPDVKTEPTQQASTYGHRRTTCGDRRDRPKLSPSPPSPSPPLLPRLRAPPPPGWDAPGVPPPSPGVPSPRCPPAPARPGPGSRYRGLSAGCCHGNDAAGGDEWHSLGSFLRHNLALLLLLLLLLLSPRRVATVPPSPGAPPVAPATGTPEAPEPRDVCAGAPSASVAGRAGSEPARRSVATWCRGRLSGRRYRDSRRAAGGGAAHLGAAGVCVCLCAFYFLIFYSCFLLFFYNISQGRRGKG